MGVSAISQAVVKKSDLLRAGRFFYTIQRSSVSGSPQGPDDQCVAVPVGANDIYQVLTGLLQSASVHTSICSGTERRAGYSLKTFSQ